MKRITGRASWRRPCAALTFMTVASLLLAACGGGGGGGVAGARAGYVAEVTTFTVQAPADAPMPEAAAASDEAEMPEAAEAPDEAAADADEGGEPEGEESEESTEGAEGAVPAEPELVDILLDILVHNQGSGMLDGITLDLTIADADDNEKERRHLWVETAGLTKGSQAQVVHELKDVAYVEGDGFHVEVRHPIPEEERGDYQEFAAEG